MNIISQFENIFSTARELYYTGKHQRALSLLDQSITLVKDQLQTVSDESRTKLAELAKEFELTSIYFAVQSIFLHNISAIDTINLIDEKLSSEQSVNLDNYYYDLQDYLGLAYYYQEISKADKDFTQADKHISKALTYRKQTNSSKLDFSYFHKGLVEQYSGNTAAAFEYYQQADELCQSTSHHYLRSFTTRHLGFLYQQADDLEKTIKMFELSLQLRLDHNILVYVPFSCISLADIYLQMDKQNQAEQLYKKGVEIAELIQLDRALALANLSLGGFYESKQLSDQALQAYLDGYYYGKKINHQGITDHISTKLRLNKIDD